MIELAIGGELLSLLGIVVSAITWAVTKQPKVKINEPVTDSGNDAKTIKLYEPEQFTGSITILDPDE